MWGQGRAGPGRVDRGCSYGYVCYAYIRGDQKSTSGRVPSGAICTAVRDRDSHWDPRLIYLARLASTSPPTEPLPNSKSLSLVLSDAVGTKEDAPDQLPLLVSGNSVGSKSLSVLRRSHQPAAQT